MKRGSAIQRIDNDFRNNLMRLVKFLRALTLLCLMAGTPVRADDPPPLPFVEGSWTIVLLPDTQRYSQNFPETFRNQTRWIVDNKERRNIAFVLHEGDIVNRATIPEWENARRPCPLWMVTFPTSSPRATTITPG